MTLQQFADLVRRMRAAQQDFFSSHSKEALRRSMALEKEVDKYLKTVPAPPPAPEQQKLL